MKDASVSDLIMEYFRKHPNKDLEHGPVVDYVEKRYLELYNKKSRDTWRAIRKLYQEGVLVKVRKGVYRYEPSLAKHKLLFEFSQATKDEIFKRDGFKCVICGRGVKDGVEIHADHKVPLQKGGTNNLENGQTLCSEHNILKKKYSQIEFGKRFMIKLYKEAVEKKDKKMMGFTKDVLGIYGKYGIDNHIEKT
jgi:hypothetical protein